MDTPTFPTPTAQPMFKVAWEKDKRKVAQLVLSDSGLTRRLNKQQLEQLSRIARGAR